MRLAVVVASGPSLTAADAARCRHPDVEVLAVNNAHLLAPWADVLYAGDYRWWEHYRPAFAGERWTCSKRAWRDLPGLQLVEAVDGIGLPAEPHRINRGLDSGYQALQLAVRRGHRFVALLGFDYQGAGHFHPDHPAALGTTCCWSQRLRHMEQLKPGLAALGVTVLNCTRGGALTAFPRASLADAGL